MAQQGHKQGQWRAVGAGQRQGIAPGWVSGQLLILLPPLSFLSPPSFNSVFIDVQWIPWNSMESTGFCRHP